MIAAVLVVCLGNICRSPMAQGAIETAARRAGLPLYVDSAGTSGWHIGDPPDPRAMAAAAARGHDITRQRARPLCCDDFDVFDLILAADRRNLSALQQRRPQAARARLGLLLDEVPALAGRDVPDPYYDGPEAFAHALDLCEQAAAALVARLAADLPPAAAVRAPTPQGR
jgi:protein-tyrosine phosphatase